MTTSSGAKRKAAKRRANDAEGSPPVEAPVETGEAVITTRLALLMLAGVIVIVYARLFTAGFVEYDDDFHVYANPFLNPLSSHGLAELWRHSYKGLYNPLTYTIWAGLAALARVPAGATSSLGQSITLDPGVFHAASVAFHVVNAWLCFLLLVRLTRRPVTALLAALVFAVHPLAVESVGWISELRGVTSACFGLAALNLLVRARRAGDGAAPTARILLGATGLLVVAAMLCKPSAVVLPLVALLVDRLALETPWRRALVTAAGWALCALPFALITRSVQRVFPEGATLWWQRPFIAGDSLAFYLYKAALPLDLGVEYGRTPHEALGQGLGYFTWVLPLGLLALCFRQRTRRPLIWLGSLLFVLFLSPTLGLVPFSFQAHSTVADRYAYLPLMGVGLIAAELVTAARSSLGLRALLGVIGLLAVRAFDQTGYWLDNVAFLHRTLEVNPDVAFAQNNLANILFKEKRVEEAIGHLEKALELDPDHALAHNNLALALVQEGRLDEAEPHFQKAVALDPKYVKAYESLGALYLRKNRLPEAIVSLERAVELAPSEAKALNDLGIAFMRSGDASKGLDAFRRAVANDPDNAQYRKNLATALGGPGPGGEAAAPSP